MQCQYPTGRQCGSVGRMTYRATGGAVFVDAVCWPCLGARLDQLKRERAAFVRWQGV